jgi:hypothetical protein
MKIWESISIVFIFVLAISILTTVFLYAQYRNNQITVQQVQKQKTDQLLYDLTPLQQKLNQVQVPLITNTCRQSCSQNVCQKFEDRISAYRGCTYCRAQNKCYSKPQDSCVECGPHESTWRCEENYGSQTRQGEYVAPIPPERNFCRLV